MRAGAAYALAVAPAAVLALADAGSAHGRETQQKQLRAHQRQNSRRHLQGSSKSRGTPLPDCSSDSPVDVWSDSERLYAGHLDGTRGGCITLTEIYNARLNDDGEPMGPLYIIDDDDNELGGTDQRPTGRWLLTDDLYIEDGVALKVWGAKYGGDADVLRLQSTDDHYFNLRGYGGSLSFIRTMVTSWDTNVGDVRESYSQGRSYISCISEVPTGDKCRGEEKDMGECRMDILSSEMGYLGYPSPEAYGLTWKVRGLCEDKSDPKRPVNENEDLFDKVNVWGDIKGSEIHHMYYGMYTFGHEGGLWTNNIMRDNHQYGFDPHDDSDNLVISYNKVYNNGNHGIIASKRCNNVQVFNNEVYNNAKSGIYFHRGCDNSAAFSNYVHDNEDAGLSIMESSNCLLYDNEVVNHDTGVRIVLGGEFNQVRNNVFENCRDYGLVTYESTDDVPWTTDGRPSDNEFIDNTVSNTPLGIRFSDGDDNVVTGNTFSDVDKLRLYKSKNIVFQDNIYSDDVCVEVSGSSSFSKDSEVPSTC